MLQIGEKAVAPPVFALWALAFRPFFLGAMGFAVIAIGLWLFSYSLGMSVPMDGISSFHWHAHEMLFGYATAVIAGFLLTAVGNWTGQTTVTGKLLAGLFVLWLGARVLMLAGTSFIEYAALLDISFGLLLLITASVPVIRVRQWKQMGILSKLLLMWVANLAFYLGAIGLLDDGVRWGIYGALYLVIGLILMMARRVVPFFIERGVGYQIELYNSKFIDIAGLVLFLVFFVAELVKPLNEAGGYIALVLAVLYLIRLIGWHTPGIWKKPLLWSLYLALVFIDLGFLLHALAVFSEVSRYLSVHAFAYGGIGLITLGMMARVTLGHTGREVQELPRAMGIAILVLGVGAVIRVLLPLLLPEQTLIWIICSQLLWMLAFMTLLIVCAPMLWQSRIDGKSG